MQSIKRFKITLTTSEPFRIGGPEDPIRGQDNPVAMVGEEIVIPGPSLKGALRSEIENYLIDSYYDQVSQNWRKGFEHIAPCIPAPTLSDDEMILANVRKYKAQGCHYPCIPQMNKCGNILHDICPACYLLGANGLSGFLRILFLRPLDGAITSSLYSAKIDRVTGTVTQGTNRPYNIVPINTKFHGEMQIILKDDIKNWIFGEARGLGPQTSGDIWLKDQKWNQNDLIQDLIVNRLKNITILGGYKSKGCGKVAIEVVAS